MISEDNKQVCIACKNTLAHGTTLCPKCSSYQKSWKNTLRYLATISAALSLFLAAIFYVVSVSYKVINAVTWKDEVKVLSLKSTDGITLANVGDGDVFITHLHYRTANNVSLDGKETGFKSNRRIDSILKKGEIQRFKLSETVPYPYDIFHTSSESEWQKILNRAFKTKDKCVGRIIYYRDGPSFEMLKSSLGKELKIFPAEAFLHYYSNQKDKTIALPIPVVGAVGISYAVECTQETK